MKRTLLIVLLLIILAAISSLFFAKLENRAALRPKVETYELKVMRADGSVVSKQTELVSLQASELHEDAHVHLSKSPELYTVFFGTNRALVSPAQPSKGFSGERSPDVTYGTCDVVIPRNHEFGSLGSSWIYRKITGSDDPVALQDITITNEAAFWEQLASKIASTKAPRRHALVFIHGYNVSFADAARRCAQVGFDLKITGATAFFSWASKGSTEWYVADGSAIDASEPALTDFLTKFAKNSHADEIHILAHSMGNRGLLRVMDRIVQNAAAESHVRFGQIFLAAPDVDAGVFANLAAAYPKVSRRTTLYVSAADKALQASTFLNGYPRAGLAPPFTIINKIDTVFVPFVNMMSEIELDHSYFGDAASVLNDMYDLVQHDTAPSLRQRISEREDGSRVYWELRP